METNNPGRGNTPGYRWVGEGQAGGLVKGDAVNAATTGSLVARFGGEPDQEQSGLATL
ncbi:hypothetical protein ACK36J_15105 [Aeromonas veronii]